MKKEKLSAYYSLLALPGVLFVTGIVLLLNPDSASTLLCRLLGVVVFLVGVGCAISAVARREALVWKVLGTLVCLNLGIWLMRNPMALAAAGGLVVGALLVIRGIQELKTYGGWAVALIVLGVMLVLLPMTTSRVVFSLCGLVMMAAGAAMAVSRLRRARLEDGGDDPSIIDAL
ncbi:MAG: DUF308 domain-containing protein [Eubacteriales bacterium]|nr:DUF308 domain-containing protein [Eubacteriales bacterium]